MVSEVLILKKSLGNAAEIPEIWLLKQPP